MALAGAVCAIGASDLRASVIGYWNFNDSNLVVDAGVGTLTVSTAGAAPVSYGTGTTFNATSGTVAGNAIGFESKSNPSPNYTYAVSMSGQTDVWLSFAAMSNASFGDATISYSSNGGTSYTTLPGTISLGSSFATSQIDLSSIAALNNNANTRFRITLNNGSSGNNKYTYFDNVQINAGNDTQITGGSNIAFGRLMQNTSKSTNVSLAKTGFLATTYSATSSVGTAIAVTADGSISSGTQSETIGLALGNGVGGTNATGAKSYTLTVKNLAGSSFASGLGSNDSNDTFNIDATVVANRVVSTSSVDFGSVFVNQAVSGSSALTSAGSDNDYTRLTVASTAAADSHGISITGGTGTTFNGSAGGSRTLAGSFSTAGSHSNSINLTTTGEGLTGEVVNGVAISYTGVALDHAKAAFNAANLKTLNLDFGTVDQDSSQSIPFSILNLTSTVGYTGKLELDSISKTGDASNAFTNDLAIFQAAAALAAGSSNGYTLWFNTATVGSYSAVYTLHLSDQDFVGAQSQSLTINVIGQVAAVPEPSIVGAAAIAGAGLIMRRRRK